MSRTLTVSIAVVVAVLLAGGVLLWIGRNDTFEAKYTSYQEATSANAAAHGMVPDFLPKSATRIVAWRNVDLNIALTEFTYEAADFDDFLRRLPTSSKEKAPPIEVPRGSELDTSKLDRFVVTAPSGCPAQLLVNRDQRRALYAYNVEPHVVGC